MTSSDSSHRSDPPARAGFRAPRVGVDGPASGPIMTDPYRPSGSLFGSPWIDKRRDVSMWSGHTVMVNVETMRFVDDLAAVIHRDRITTRFGHDAFWVDLWPWRAGREVRSWYRFVRGRVSEAWDVLRHGLGEDEDDD